ncbi:CaiB/BaiF CoA transferase family protein [Comamonas sp. NoAH]|uniref:CaiB/BaiF CoA transferase family protein n=1 Tax=Comamonas halotolerans TaxID=3041496 RepID=UPI0024E14F90|nr:CoA transferase [Comamonas sp. NoAH]
MTLSHLHRQGPRGPLSGVRVLDLSAYIAGPYGCSLLADQGAEVIKIEPPVGDNLRKYPSTLEAESRAFIGVNRSKWGMVLDLKQKSEHATLMRLVRNADVLVHNFRPGVPERLGIGFDQLMELNPRLIYCSVTGYGKQGPMKSKAGYDQVLQTMTGMCAMQGEAGTPEILYGSVVDYYAAALVASGVASALYERTLSGRGQHVGVSLLRSALTMQSARLIWAEGEPRDVGGRDMRSGGITGLHPTKQGYLYLSANTQHFWEALCHKVGLSDLASDLRFDTVRKRAQRHAELVPLLRQALASRTALEWEELFGDEVPCAAAREVEDMFDHPQVLAENLIENFSHPTLGSYRGFSGPWDFSRTPGPVPFAAPTLGQHTAVLKGVVSSEEKA